MPIRPEFREYYRGPVWQEIRKRILTRAGNRCERCGRPGGKITDVVAGGFWRLNAHSAWRDRNGVKRDPPFTWTVYRKRCQLGVAHLDHNPANMADDNLCALCQACHLRNDRGHHYATMRRTRAARVGQQWLSRELAESA